MGISLYLANILTKPIAMYTKSILWVGAFLVSAAFIFSGCQSSKVAYGNSYYFKQTPKTVAKPAPKVEATDEATLEASVAEETAVEETVETRMQEAKEKIAAALADENNAELQASFERTKQLVSDMDDEQLTKKEVRVKRKELKKEIRTLTKEFKNAAPEATQEIHRYLKYSLILFGVAVLLSIIAAVTVTGGFGVLWALSSIAWLAGAVFFVLWLLEEFG